MPEATSPGHGARIDTVRIEGNSRTRTEVVQRELLFGVGDLIDSSLVAESERNLRRLPYLGNAGIDLRHHAGSRWSGPATTTTSGRVALSTVPKSSPIRASG